jgi:hypothetical protein
MSGRGATRIQIETAIQKSTQYQIINPLINKKSD